MGFSADWLALREPADRAARNPGLMAAAVPPDPAPLVLDLGCGTGATVRALAPLMPGARWRLVDNDPALLELGRAAIPGAEAHLMDLRDPAALPLDGVMLVTCSALLDLMPGPWVAALARVLAERRLPFHAALSYDGAMAWHPVRPGDAPVTAAFNRHQRGDKGLGPALGPESVPATERAFARHGYAVRTADSPWRLGPADAALHRVLLTGIAAAAAEAGAPEAGDWLAARLSGVDSARCTVGHRDLLALPPGL